MALPRPQPLDSRPRSTPNPELPALHHQTAPTSPRHAPLVVQVGPEGTVRRVSEAWLPFCDGSTVSMIGRSWEEVAPRLGLDEAPAETVRRALAQRSALPVQGDIRDLCGEAAPIHGMVSPVFDSQGFPDGVLLCAVSPERPWADRPRLRELERLAALSEVAGGVAHELKNPLTALAGLAELLAAEEVGSQARRYVGAMKSQTQRALRIVSSFLSVLSPPKPVRRPVSLTVVAEEALELMRYQLEVDGVEVKAILDPETPFVSGNPHEIQQVAVNLLSNAHQAVGDCPERTVEVETRARGDCVQLLVRDSGPGIPASVLPQIFEPFFTTKPEDRGTGLGLTISLGLAQQHGGSLTARNHEAGGAEFILELPASSTQTPRPQKQIIAVEEPPEREDDAAARGRLLVVDDEESLRVLMVEALRAGGYQVDAAEDGEEALQQLQGKGYDLVICDLRMPGLSGEDLYEQLRATAPELTSRFIFVTGDILAGDPDGFVQRSGSRILEKPFTLRQLLDTTRAALR
ncbi:response regulator [bacterium]|nr:response regulator [bacterium]